MGVFPEPGQGRLDGAGAGAMAEAGPLSLSCACLSDILRPCHEGEPTPKPHSPAPATPPLSRLTEHCEHFPASLKHYTSQRAPRGSAAPARCRAARCTLGAVVRAGGAAAPGRGT